VVNKSASLIGTLVFVNGNRNTLHIGTNSNTGETIVWQQVTGRRSSRLTGKNIAAFAAELTAALGRNEASWEGTVNNAALTALWNTARALATA
jgi:hypothetical protein